MAECTELQVKGLGAYLAQNKVKFASVLPSHIKPERLFRSVLIAAQQNPNILRCTQESILSSALRAAELGLDCSGGFRGEGYLIPFKDKCEFVPGYKGLINLARNAGDYIEFYADVVRANDHFVVRKGSDPKLEHEPLMGTDEERGQRLFAYAVARTREGSTQWDYMPWADILKIRDRSNGWKSYKKKKDAGEWAKDNPWDTDEDEMAKKTVLRRLVKLLPLSSDKAKALARAIEIEDRVEFGDAHAEASDIVDGTFIDTTQKSSKTQQLAATLSPNTPTSGSSEPSAEEKAAILAAENTESLVGPAEPPRRRGHGA